MPPLLRTSSRTMAYQHCPAPGPRLAAPPSRCGRGRPPRWRAGPRTRRRLPRSVPPAISPPPMSRRPWPRGRASVSATRRIASVSVEGGQALSFADSSFDVVLCNLGLMFFPDPVRGLSEFRRVLRPGGRVAVSVNTVVERSYNHQINVMIARYVPSLAEAVTRTFALGEASKLQLLFNEAG